MLLLVPDGPGPGPDDVDASALPPGDDERFLSGGEPSVFAAACDSACCIVIEFPPPGPRKRDNGVKVKKSTREAT